MGERSATHHGDPPQGRESIAHRLLTVARMDRLVVLDHGGIAETGSHAVLLAAGGPYARIWRRQSGGFAEAAEQRRGRARAI
jgi:ATP-binding cassette subfamily B multidrug efflux pump